MDYAEPYVIVIAAIVLSTILLKVFFTLWRVVDKRLHPEKLSQPENTPEIAFRGLKRKTVDVHMKTGGVLRSHKYKKTLVFADGEFAACTLLYFELESPDGNQVFICGSDITKLETCKRP